MNWKWLRYIYDHVKFKETSLVPMDNTKIFHRCEGYSLPEIFLCIYITYTGRHTETFHNSK